MKRLLTYLFLLDFVFYSEVWAGTDFLCNAMAQSNIFLKKAGQVQHEYSSIARKYLSLKVSPDDLLGDSGRAAKEKAEKLKEKAESLKEKAEKVKEFAEQAKERKEELEAQALALKAKAEEKMAAAQEVIAKGKAANEEALNKAREAREKAQAVQNKFNDIKEKGEDTITEDTARTKEQKALDMTKDDEITEIVEVEKGTKTAKELAQEQDNISSKIKRNLSLEHEIVGNSNNILIQQGAIKPIFNQADVITSAVSMAEETIVIPEEQVVEVISPLEDINSVSVTADEVMALAKNKKETENNKQEIKSNINIEEQLLQATSKIKSNNKKIKDINKVKIIDEKLEMSKRQTVKQLQSVDSVEIKTDMPEAKKAVIKGGEDEEQI
ncbi:MAG: hypothetical protein E7020_06590 [Alphaproteobacteria bacterium]|nr:hypothetical protein [Alphaproteobacteria bacterium]